MVVCASSSAGVCAASRLLPPACSGAPDASAGGEDAVTVPAVHARAEAGEQIVEPGHGVGALEHVWWEAVIASDVRATHWRCKPAGWQVLHSVVLNLWRRRSHLGVALQPATAWGADGPFAAWLSATS